ncbi:MAG: hypothetical protein HQM08_21300 [Candidatus Riflebacteria bacterium]|nr:hypothetical protein [Candidatus Riflebacteria bacterium]
MNMFRQKMAGVKWEGGLRRIAPDGRHINPAPWRCPVCGKASPASSQFCGFCGRPASLAAIYALPGKPPKISFVENSENSLSDPEKLGIFQALAKKYRGPEKKNSPVSPLIPIKTPQEDSLKENSKEQVTSLIEISALQLKKEERVEIPIEKGKEREKEIEKRTEEENKSENDKISENIQGKDGSNGKEKISLNFNDSLIEKPIDSEETREGKKESNNECNNESNKSNKVSNENEPWDVKEVTEKNETKALSKVVVGNETQALSNAAVGNETEAISKLTVGTETKVISKEAVGTETMASSNKAVVGNEARAENEIKVENEAGTQNVSKTLTEKGPESEIKTENGQKIERKIVTNSPINRIEVSSDNNLRVSSPLEKAEDFVFEGNPETLEIVSLPETINELSNDLELIGEFTEKWDTEIPSQPQIDLLQLQNDQVPLQIDSVQSPNGSDSQLETREKSKLSERTNRVGNIFFVDFAASSQTSVEEDLPSEVLIDADPSSELPNKRMGIVHFKKGKKNLSRARISSKIISGSNQAQKRLNLTKIIGKSLLLPVIGILQMTVVSVASPFILFDSGFSPKASKTVDTVLNRLEKPLIWSDLKSHISIKLGLTSSEADEFSKQALGRLPDKDEIMFKTDLKRMRVFLAGINGIPSGILPDLEGKGPVFASQLNHEKAKKLQFPFVDVSLNHPVYFAWKNLLEMGLNLADQNHQARPSDDLKWTEWREIAQNVGDLFKKYLDRDLPIPSQFVYGVMTKDEILKEFTGFVSQLPMQKGSWLEKLTLSSNSRMEAFGLLSSMLNGE